MKKYKCSSKLSNRNGSERFGTVRVGRVGFYVRIWMIVGGGLRPPNVLALGFVFEVLGQVFSRVCQENPRTCRGQGREQIRTDYHENLRYHSFVLPDSLSYHKPPCSKRWAAVLPPEELRFRFRYYQLHVNDFSMDTLMF